jgi:hypothetical protein
MNQPSVSVFTRLELISKMIRKGTWSGDPSETTSSEDRIHNNHDNLVHSYRNEREATIGLVR